MQDAILQALRRNAADDAVALAREWVISTPDNAATHRWLGLALQQQGQPALALASIETALTLTPEDADLHLLRAGLLLATRDLSAADAALSRTTALDPNQFNAYVMQAHLAVARGDLDDAQRLSRTAARLAPEHPQLLAVDGVVELRRGQSDHALSLLTRAAEQLPDDPRVLFALGFAYLQKEHFAFAERAFERVVELNPPGTALRAFIAQLAQRQGRLDDALAAMQGVFAQPGGDISAMRRLAGEMELQAGRPDQAVAHLRLALAHWPADRRTLHALLTAWERLGAVDDARDTLDAALATSVSAHDLWLARLAVEPVGGPQAQAVIERWLLGMPEHLPALEALMRVHDMQGHAEEAEMVARQIVAVEPGRISGEQRIVEALLERDPPAAIACVQSLIDSLPENQQTVLRPWLGNVQDRAGQPDAALATWMQFQREQAQHRLPLPPQAAKQPMQWPALGTIPDAVTARPLFVWGVPGSHVERLIAVMGAATPLVRDDRYGTTPPSDALQSYRSVEQLASGELAPLALVEGWKAQLPRRGIDDGNVIDWLLWWDNTLLTALRPHLPEGRLAIALRDPRDMLLDWLSAGAPAPLAVQSPQQAADWLLAALEQLAVLHERDLYPHRIIRLDGIESDPQGISTALEQAFGLSFPLIEPRGPARLASGRWRNYRSVLGAQFDLLTLIAVRFGYPQD
ncbi:tetratricopeptide repeat protein [Xanthomonas hortorum]|uniref:Beta-barrel assembly-enhancing protease n=1 Tax=Xanthomonas hortorum pv. pelargonii TaxID=453602 RepID=A0A6V7BIN7_9XANT|nr:tetratricopeptide repeat protein [Xanthomonas hortorum]MCE4354393.1 tetratricopeptide repeat protein [Xanthomonas hortorum pv. pelargonii]MCM5523777.1 tetratricopeptide repeat protein [Xanthomonas hortorum pv. pelargonii]MCM5536360.1 tetratricopeptide repeat protein [Xanthomonas hortorum pv. pelargonii]MCM5540469.1 tetratricopeptide repeat protein [Xanthomonas hortorum pv. pelargonii]MCM5543869.1 tetratricopeptide repeat protein [Xanthomonas hortorum pv. pelargonii]